MQAKPCSDLFFVLLTVDYNEWFYFHSVGADHIAGTNHG